MDWIGLSSDLHVLLQLDDLERFSSNIPLDFVVMVIVNLLKYVSKRSKQVEYVKSNVGLIRFSTSKRVEICEREKWASKRE